MSKELKNSPSRMRSAGVEQSSGKIGGGGSERHASGIPVRAGRKPAWERPTLRMIEIEGTATGPWETTTQEQPSYRPIS